MLMACRRFGIHGADGMIRKMLPLVFSRDPGVFLQPRTVPKPCGSAVVVHTESCFASSMRS